MQLVIINFSKNVYLHTSVNNHGGYYFIANRKKSHHYVHRGGEIFFSPPYGIFLVSPPPPREGPTPTKIYPTQKFFWTFTGGCKNFTPP